MTPVYRYRHAIPWVVAAKTSMLPSSIKPRQACSSATQESPKVYPVEYKQMQRFCSIVLPRLRAVSGSARSHLLSSMLSFPSTFNIVCIKRASFAKKSSGKGNAASDSSKSAAVVGSGKNSASKSNSKNADSDNLNAEAEMQAIIATLK
jgi:hypothetical protein